MFNHMDKSGISDQWSESVNNKFYTKYSNGKIILICMNCFKKEEFDSEQEAFDKGWDCPPFFTQVITCSDCSSAEFLLKCEKE